MTTAHCCYPAMAFTTRCDIATSQCILYQFDRRLRIIHFHNQFVVPLVVRVNHNGLLRVVDISEDSLAVLIKRPAIMTPGTSSRMAASIQSNSPFAPLTGHGSHPLANHRSNPPTKVAGILTGHSAQSGFDRLHNSYRAAGATDVPGSANRSLREVAHISHPEPNGMLLSSSSAPRRNPLDTTLASHWNRGPSLDTNE